jgi:hypothetical protein
VTNVAVDALFLLSSHVSSPDIHWRAGHAYLRVHGEWQLIRLP